MSTGNDNFITLDSIAEIQDIVNGDYLFTISNGVIYKLDFQNFIIGKQNTDFFTTIDTLSAQVVSNTQSLCAINAYLNEIKPSLDEIDSLYTTVNELSSNWNTTYTTVNTLSSQAFLPISNDTNNIQSGSMLYYNGIDSKFITLPPGGISQVLSITDNGLPGFTDSAGSGNTLLLVTDTQTIINLSNYGKGSGRFYDETKNYVLFTDSVKSYKNVRVGANLNVIDTTVADAGYITQNRLIISYGNDIIAPISNGVAVIDELPAGTAIKAKVIVEGGAPQNGSRRIDFNYNINGIEDLPSA
jgi:hypothetical protein